MYWLEQSINLPVEQKEENIPVLLYTMAGATGGRSINLQLSRFREAKVANKHKKSEHAALELFMYFNTNLILRSFVLEMAKIKIDK